MSRMSQAVAHVVVARQTQAIVTVRPTIRRSARIAECALGRLAARTVGRCLTAGLVALLLAFLAALPDDVAAMPASHQRGVASVQMQAAPEAGIAKRATVLSASLTDADLPPGDGRDLRLAVPVLVRPPVSARFAIALSADPSPARPILPERPPRAA